MNFKKEIAELIHKKAKLTKQEIENLIETPPNPELGDYSFPCFQLASKLKKNPNQIAQTLAEIKPKSPVKEIKALGPYLNFFISKPELAKQVLENINENYGKSKQGKNKKILIDFSSPNIGKPMHIGHIRSTIIGDSLIRTFDYLGYNPIGINYLGDVGLHIGKLIVAWELWIDKEALKKDPVKELLRIYVKFNENEKAEFEEGEEDYEGNEWTEKARQEIKKLELGDENAHKIWEEIRNASGKGFDKVYKMLKVDFHETTGQSKFSETGREIILENAKKGIVHADPKTGAINIDLGKLGKKYILKSGGVASYVTQDIGAAVHRFEKHNPEKIIYITDFRQELHFKQLKEILKIFGYSFSDKIKHLGFGTVKFGKEIIASRTGKIILLEDVLKKTIEKAQENIDKKQTKGDGEKVGISAIKYTILRNEPIKDVQFSWEEALNFEGETGPYLQYSYARASSILRKSKKKPKLDMPENLSKSEIALIKKIANFPDIIERTSKTLNPSIMANYSYTLAKTFNEFYHATRVLDSTNEEFLLKIIEAFRTTLKNSLHLLGIEVMEEM